MKKRYTLLVVFLTMVQMIGIAQEPRVYQAPVFDAEWSKPSQYPDRIVLSLGEDAKSTASVTWRTNADIYTAFAEIAVATGAPKFWRNAQTFQAKTTLFDGANIASAEVVANYHSVVFEKLMSGTTYAYRVGDGQRWSEWIQFKTAHSDPEKPFSFLYLGDAQNYILELWSRLIREGYKKAPDAGFIIHAGDLINSAHREQEWQEWFDAGGWIHSNLPSFPVPGNHEYRAVNEEEQKANKRSLSAQWRPQFTLPNNGPQGLEETAYFMDYQNTRIIGLNSNVEYQKQAIWLEEVLSKTTKKWKVVTFHHPLFSASDGRDNTELRNLWKPILDKYKVDLVLQGHDHAYARGRVSPGNNNLNGVNLRDQTGTVYVVSVSGGKMYNMNVKGWDDLGAHRDKAAENTQLFQVINIAGDKLTYQSFTAIGELYDAFDLIKKPNAPNTFIERKDEGIASLRFTNTIPYEDQLPEPFQKKLLDLHNGYSMGRVIFVKVDGQFRYRIQLRKGDDFKSVEMDRDGNVVE
jgi:3',5'-cyclic AMP phosphodiesterase CpdA